MCCSNSGYPERVARGRLVCPFCSLSFFVVCPLVIPRGLPEEDLSVLLVVCPLVIQRGLPGEDLSVLYVVCPLVIPKGLPGEDLSVLFVVCPLVIPRGLPGEDLFRLSFTTKCFVVFWDPDTRQSLILILQYSFHLFTFYFINIAHHITKAHPHLLLAVFIVI